MVRSMNIDRKKLIPYPDPHLPDSCKISLYLYGPPPLSLFPTLVISTRHSGQTRLMKDFVVSLNQFNTKANASYPRRICKVVTSSLMVSYILLSN